MNYKKVVRIFAVLVMLLIIIPITAEGESALEYYIKGNDCLTNMKFEEALNYFNKALGINPKYVEAYIGKGMALYKLGELEKADKCFSRVIELNPSEKIGWYGKGIVYVKEKKYEEAIQNFDKALKIDGDFKKAREGKQEAINGIAGHYISKADALFSMKNYSDAIKYYDKALEITPADEYVLKKKEEAKKSLTLQQLTPLPTIYIIPTPITAETAEEWKLKGNEHLKKQEYDKALICFEKSLEFDSNYARSIHNIGVVYTDKKEYEKALEYFDKAIALVKSGKDTSSLPVEMSYDTKAQIFINLKKYEEAIKCVDIALENNSKDLSAYFFKGRSFDKQGKYEEAIKCYDKALEIDPKCFNAWYNKAANLYELGKIKEALQCIEECILLNPNDQDAKEKKKLLLDKLNISN